MRFLRYTQRKIYNKKSIQLFKEKRQQLTVKLGFSIWKYYLINKKNQESTEIEVLGLYYRKIGRKILQEWKNRVELKQFYRNQENIIQKNQEQKLYIKYFKKIINLTNKQVQGLKILNPYLNQKCKQQQKKVLINWVYQVYKRKEENYKKQQIMQKNQENIIYSQFYYWAQKTAQKRKYTNILQVCKIKRKIRIQEKCLLGWKNVLQNQYYCEYAVEKIKLFQEYNIIKNNFDKWVGKYTDCVFDKYSENIVQQIDQFQNVNTFVNCFNEIKKYSEYKIRKRNILINYCRNLVGKSFLGLFEYSCNQRQMKLFRQKREVILLSKILRNWKKIAKNSIKEQERYQQQVQAQQYTNSEQQMDYQSNQDQDIIKYNNNKQKNQENQEYLQDIGEYNKSQSINNQNYLNTQFNAEYIINGVKQVQNEEQYQLSHLSNGSQNKQLLYIQNENVGQEQNSIIDDEDQQKSQFNQVGMFKDLKNYSEQYDDDDGDDFNKNQNISHSDENTEFKKQNFQSQKQESGIKSLINNQQFNQFLNLRENLSSDKKVYNNLYKNNGSLQDSGKQNEQQIFNNLNFSQNNNINNQYASYKNSANQSPQNGLIFGSGSKLGNSLNKFQQLLQQYKNDDKQEIEDNYENSSIYDKQKQMQGFQQDEQEQQEQQEYQNQNQLEMEAYAEQQYNLLESNLNSQANQTGQNMDQNDQLYQENQGLNSCDQENYTQNQNNGSNIFDLQMNFGDLQENDNNLENQLQQIDNNNTINFLQYQQKFQNQQLNEDEDVNDLI
ncbi:hypothetical protein PPERSA_07769 [Pseudocohnilembus persalinus]|uniref:Uncharacterized protein n=1 Tax=Pseudocohnilembus persalinus TaxID=266149 RepID=A0A0V0R9T9_PSEPJ|nr:hypothetical protein PPERSA_07769 [Pseudocohnilembus persalinus]|eukprot:KRX11244.1 hypothetical protein PPERSA_07769 [Pseudocohnilembus persalinus]